MNYAQNQTGRLYSKSLPTFIALIVIAVGANAFGQRAEDIIFTPEKIKTIPGHGMSKGEYPFDVDGYYRKEWVSVSAKSKVRSSTTINQPIPVTSEQHSNFKANQRIKESRQTKPEIKAPVTMTKADPIKPTPPPAKPTFTIPTSLVMTDAEAKQRGFIGPFEKMQEPLARPAMPSLSLTKSTPTATASMSPISSLYHKVNSGDTLFSISRKYGSTVDAIKKANGLTSDLIRVGQSLRLALAQHTLGVPQ